MAFLLPARLSYAAAITVTTLDDELNADGDCSLREALKAANTDTAVDACIAGSGADTISLPTGTFTLFIAGSDDTGDAGDLDIFSDLTLSGVSALDTAINASAINDRIFHIVGSGGTPLVTLADMTIRGGFADHGGGIYNQDGDLSLSGVLVEDNIAETTLAMGGGIYNLSGSLTVQASTFRYNQANNTNPAALSNSGGGAIANDGGTLQLTGTTIFANTSLRDGAGIYTEGGSLTITNGHLTTNISEIDGGAIFAIDTNITMSLATLNANQADGGGGGMQTNDSTVLLTNVEILDNIADGSGGGIATVGSDFEIIDSTINRNQAIGFGGGIFNRNGKLPWNVARAGILTLTNVTINDNTTVANPISGIGGNGGGIRNHSDGGDAILEIIDSRITLNQALGNDLQTSNGTGDGGGISNYAKDVTGIADASIFNTLIDSNLSASDFGINLGDGGGIHNFGQAATLTLEDSTVSFNQATEGGGIANQSGTVSLLNSLIDHNNAFVSQFDGHNRGDGGGIHQTSFSSNGVMILTGSTISNNSAVSIDLGTPTGSGGGIYVDLSSSLAISDSTINDNTANLQGGGLKTSVDTTIDNSLFDGNISATGGGISAVGSVMELTLTESTLKFNMAYESAIPGIGGGFGGGLYTAWGSVVMVNNSTIENNEASLNGGGIYNDGSTPTVPNLFLNNSTISTNEATVEGGGIYNYRDGILSLYNVTVSNNRSNGSAGIYNDFFGIVNVLNSIVATQNFGAECGGFGALISLGYNLESGTLCGFTALGDLQNTDPLLLPLDYYGGPTKTHKLDPLSPAIDAADPAGCQSDLDGDGILELLTIDQRGQIDVDIPLLNNDAPNAFCDIGAFEHNLLFNGGFEVIPNPIPLPVGWLGYQLGGQGQQYCAFAHSGACSFVLQPNGNGLRGLYQRIEEGGQAGDNYTMTVWYATQNLKGPGSVGALVRFLYTDGSSQTFTVRFKRNSHGWRQATLDFNAAQDYDTIIVMPLASTLQKGRIAIDDVSLVKSP